MILLFHHLHNGVGRTCFESDGPTDEVRHLSSEGSSMMLDDVGGCRSASFTGCTHGVGRTCFESDGPTDEVRQLSSKGSSMSKDVGCWSAGVTGGVV